MAPSMTAASDHTATRSLCADSESWVQARQATAAALGCWVDAEKWTPDLVTAIFTAGRPLPADGPLVMALASLPPPRDPTTPPLPPALRGLSITSPGSYPTANSQHLSCGPGTPQHDPKGHQGIRGGGKWLNGESGDLASCQYAGRCESLQTRLL